MRGWIFLKGTNNQGHATSMAIQLATIRLIVENQGHLTIIFDKEHTIKTDGTWHQTIRAMEEALSGEGESTYEP